MATIAALSTLGLSLPATALALGGPPIISATSFSEVTTTSATLEASLDPNLQKTTYSFQYISEAAWQADGEAFGAGTEATLQAEISTSLTETHQVSATLEGLTPATAYHFRLFAKNNKSPAEGSPGEARIFATYAATPDFLGACPTNEAFREAGSPSALLPECRAYEQVSPTDKGGADINGGLFRNQASPYGEAFVFQGDSGGISEGTEGSQEGQAYLSRRQGGAWATRGALPPLAAADRATTGAWTEDLSLFFDPVSRIGNPASASVLLADPFAATYQPLFPYQAASAVDFHFLAASADDAEVFFESTEALPVTSGPAPLAGKPNLYRYQRQSGTLTVVSLLPTAEGGGPAAAFGGPYDWWQERTSDGGARADYFTAAEHAVSADGEDAFFTSQAAAQLYERRGIATQSPETLRLSASDRTPPDPAGTSPAAFQAASADGDAAFFTSPEELTDDAHTGPEVPGPKLGRLTIGPAPDEEPEEELPELLKDHHAVGIAVSSEYVYWADPLDGTIGRAKLDGSNTPTVVEDPFITPGETCAETHPETEPGEEQCAPSAPRYVALGPCSGGGQCVYWTNTGPLGGDLNQKPENRPTVGAGTIGRAELDGSGALVPDSIEPEFIAGASNPQGIAVNESHIYWVNSQHSLGMEEQDIARSELDGSAVEQRFYDRNGSSESLFGVALSPTRVYWTQENSLGFGSVNSIPLDGGSIEGVGFGEEDGYGNLIGPKPMLRGIAVIGPHVYWTAQGEGEIGRMRLPLHEPSDPDNNRCTEIPRCQPNFLSVGGAPTGLAADPSGEHLYWSANGELPPHPGSDLYRFQAQGTGGCNDTGGCLTDLTPDPTDEAGADVQGVLGASADGSRLYFAANGVLAQNTVDYGAGPEAAETGSCAQHGSGWSGVCNLYAWEEDGSPAGTIAFIARLDASGIRQTSDARDWEPSGIAPNSPGLIGRRSAFASADGASLVFASQRPLTGYDNRATGSTGGTDACGENGKPGEPCAEYYRYQANTGRLTCLTCLPTGQRPSGAPTLDSIGIGPGFGRTHPFLARNLSASGDRFFFESPDPLVLADTNAQGGCPPVEAIVGGPAAPACQDLYEWEAPGSGSCKEGGPGYAPLDGGCLYLLSTGAGSTPSYFADASANGNDVFLFSRSQLVGQDTDHILDAYDARTGGGLASQYPAPAEVCESAEACHGQTGEEPQAQTPATPSFHGSGNVHEKPTCPKGNVRRHGQCVKRGAKHRKRHKRHAHAKRRTHR